MKASVYLQYGAADVLQLGEVEKPKPKDNQLLIKVVATTVTGADRMMREGKPKIGRLYLGLTKPKRTVLGFDFAGEIVEMGKGCGSFKIGDKVFGGTTTLGCYAEYLCINADDVIAKIPDNSSYQEVAPISGSGITVLHFLKGLAKIKAGDKVLINGASGSLGTYAVQLAKYFGASVTGVCSSTNLELVQSLGADAVIDYTKEDFTQNGLTYDIIFDTVGKSSFSACQKSLTKTGVYMSSVMSFSLLLRIIWSSLFGNKKAKTAATGMLAPKKRLEYLLELTEILKTGKLKTVIDRQYPLSQMAEAHQYVETGRKKGNVVIEI